MALKNAKCKIEERYALIYKVASGKWQVASFGTLRVDYKKVVNMRSYTSLRKERARNTTAPCGRCRECELAQWSKSCEVNNEQTILGTTRGAGPPCYLLYDIIQFQANRKLYFMIKFSGVVESPCQVIFTIKSRKPR